MLYSVVILKMGPRGGKSSIVLHCQIILCTSIPERTMFEKIKVTTQIASFCKFYLKLAIYMDFRVLLRILFLTFKTFSAAHFTWVSSRDSYESPSEKVWPRSLSQSQT